MAAPVFPPLEPPSTPLPLATPQPPPLASSAQGSHSRHASPAFTHSRSASGPVQTSSKKSPVAGTYTSIERSGTWPRGCGIPKPAASR